MIPRVQSGVRRIQPRRCLVIGAGVLGASVAARLAGAGMRVTLLEADQPGRGTSRWSFAWVNSNDKGPKPYHDLNHAGIRAWAELAPGLDGTAWYRPAGHVELADPIGRAELAARVHRLAGGATPPASSMRPKRRSSSPRCGFPGRGSSAAWFPGEAYLLTEPLIERLVAHVTSQGGTVLTGDRGRVTGLDADPPGRVRTAAGDVLAADEIVCCAGRWTPRLTAMARPACPVPLVAWDTPGSPAPALIVRVGPVSPEGPVRLIHTPEIALRPHSGGLLHLEAPDAAVDLYTPDPDLRRWATEFLHRARRTVRGLQDAVVAATRSACARCPPTSSPSSAACPAPSGSTSR